MANEFGPNMHARGGVGVLFSGGCIRFDSRWGYPKVHVNETHDSVGIKGVKINERGNLEIEHEGGEIITMFADPDETMVARMITAGCSGGGGRTEITMTDHHLKRVLDLNHGGDWLRLHDQWSNLWVGWVHKA